MAGVNDGKRPAGRSLARIFVWTAVIVALPLGLLEWLHTHVCLTEVYENVPVANSDWIVERQGVTCPLQVSGGFTIQARNTRTDEVVVIAEQDDEPDTKVVNDGADHVVIRVDNRTLLRPIHDTFGPVHVSYGYLPRDDPQDRAAFQRWYYDQRAPNNIDWACSNILAHMDKANRQSFDEMLAYWNFRDSDRKSYCQQSH